MHTLSQVLSGELTGTTRLKISAGLTAFPKEIYAFADTLEILDLSDNSLSSLPEDFGRLYKLRIVFFSNNIFTEFPSVLAQCPDLVMIGFKANQIALIAENSFPLKLRWLILTDNCITQLPKSIGTCVYLQKVMFAGNKLTSLPIEMEACRNIELLRISANAFTALPVWLLSLPKLSWLAYAGNPFSKPEHSRNDLNEIDWNALELKELLGQGASGVISKAFWPDESKEVAVKVFKGEVTSDGLPEDEMNACIEAGIHPNLVEVLGKLHLHPEGKKGLVFGLIPDSFHNLGGPPDFDTCTRDTFPEHTLFSLLDIGMITSRIASVLTHLHARGIMHGDMYAHNILINDEAHPLFGDFGAAVLYDRASERAPLIERIEVRAFGCLLDDLLRYLDPADADNSRTAELQQLRNSCMLETIIKRPDFSSIAFRIQLLFKE